MANKTIKCNLQVPGFFHLETENITSGALIALISVVFVFILALALVISWKSPSAHLGPSPKPVTETQIQWKTISGPPGKHQP